MFRELLSRKRHIGNKLEGEAGAGHYSLARWDASSRTTSYIEGAEKQRAHCALRAAFVVREIY